MDTRYLPATAAALAVGASVMLGIYVTHSAYCLWGLFFLAAAIQLMPVGSPAPKKPQEPST